LLEVLSLLTNGNETKAADELQLESRSQVAAVR